MRGCLFIIVLAGVALALIVVVGLPAAAASVLTAGATAAGLDADDTTVTVSSDPPTDLVALHADRVRVRATDATFRGLEIGSLDVTLLDVGIVDRTARGVDGRLDDVTVPDVGGRDLRLASIRLQGTGDNVRATTTIPGTDARALIEQAVETELGAAPSSVTLGAPDRVVARIAGLDVEGRLAVSGAGDLVVRVASGPSEGEVVTLLRSGDDLPIRLTDVTVTGAGALRLEGELSLGLLG